MYWWLKCFNNFHLVVYFTSTSPQLLPPAVSKDLSITWDFFATSHGKGSVDGVGGGVKRGVHQKIMSRQDVVKTAEEYSRVAAEVCPNVTVLYITEDQIVG